MSEGTNGTEPTVGARAVAAMWLMLGLAATFADQSAEAGAAAGPMRAPSPVGGRLRPVPRRRHRRDGRPADGPAGGGAQAVEPVWSLAVDLDSEFWFNWAQALLGWAVAAEDAARRGWR